MHLARLVWADYGHGTLWWYAHLLAKTLNQVGSAAVTDVEVYSALQAAAQRLVEVGNDGDDLPPLYPRKGNPE